MPDRLREIERFEVVGRSTRRQHTVLLCVREHLVTTIHTTAGSWVEVQRWLQTADDQPVNAESDGTLVLAASGEVLEPV